MSEVKSAKYRRELLGIGYLNIVKRQIANGAQFVVVRLKVAWNDQNLKELPRGVFDANVLKGVVTEISAAPLIGGKHRVGRIWPGKFGPYHVRIFNRNVRQVGPDARAHLKGG